LALHMVFLGLCVAAWPWKPFSWSFRQLFSWRCFKAFWNLVVSVVTKDRGILYSMHFSTWQSRPVGLCGLPLHGCFHLIALTVDRGSSSRQKYDELTWWHPMKVFHWKLLSSSVRPFYCQCLSMEIAWLCARFYKPVSNWCVWNTQIHSFEVVSTYFCVYIL
jgi:hypothetical protein